VNGMFSSLLKPLALKPLPIISMPHLPQMPHILTVVNIEGTVMAIIGWPHLDEGTTSILLLPPHYIKKSMENLQMPSWMQWICALWEILYNEYLINVCCRVSNTQVHQPFCSLFFLTKNVGIQFLITDGII
jgi:hypothetical protein